MRHKPFLGLPPLLGLCLALLLLLQGCYSFSGASLPEHIRTVAVPVFEGGAARYRADLTRYLTDRIESGSQLRTTPSLAEADGLIEGTITRFVIEPNQLSSTTERAQTNRVTIVVRVTMDDRVERKQLFSQSFVGFADYRVGEYLGQQRAIRSALLQLSEEIFDRVVSGW